MARAALDGAPLRDLALSDVYARIRTTTVPAPVMDRRRTGPHQGSGHGASQPRPIRGHSGTVEVFPQRGHMP